MEDPHNLPGGGRSESPEADGPPGTDVAGLREDGAQPFLEAILFRLPVATVLLAGDRVAYANAAAGSLFAREPRDLLGRTPADLSRVGEDFSAAISAAVGGLAPLPFAWTCARPDGTLLECEVELSAVVLRGRTYSLAMIRETAWRTEPEGELRRAQRVDLLGQLAAGIAHDFNNLLTAIKGHLDVALETGGDPRRLRESLDKARVCAARASSLSRRLLDLSREDPFEPEPVVAANLVEGVVPLLESVLRPDVELEVRIETCDSTVQADRGQIEQALMNLALNAQDAMPDGGRLTLQVYDEETDESWVAAHPWARPGRYVRVDVRDTGIGIAPEDRDRIFQPFHTSKPKGQGTGLGLSVVYGIVKQHRGFILVDSLGQSGTVFSLMLPAAGEAAPVAARAPGAAAACRPRPEEGATVLLVEDEAMICDLARTRLAALGLKVLAARSSVEAEQLFASEECVDLLVTDLVIPGKSGKDLARDLVARCPSLKVIYTTGYDAQGLPRNLAPDSGSTLLQKPYRLGELGDTVLETLRGE